VGALCARTAALGAYLNIRINASDLTDEAERKGYLDRANDLRSTLEAREAEVLAQVEAKLD
jgi:glutamate formiminotransferase/formiminotetrahydrofolate cyclodeaminase